MNKAEPAYLKSLSLLAKRSSDLIMITNPQEQVLWVNDGFCLTTGYSLEEVKGKRSAEFLQGTESDPRSIDKMAKAIQKKESIELEIINYRKDGTPYHVKLEIIPVFDEAGEVLHYISVGKDISQHNQMMQIIANQEKQLEFLFTQSLVGVFIMMLKTPITWNEQTNKEAALDKIFAEQRITKVNNVLVKQYAYPKESLIGLTPNELFAHNITYARKIWKKLFSEGYAYIENKAKRANGNIITIKGDYTCLYNDQGQIIGHFGIQQDISEVEEQKAIILNQKMRLKNIIKGTNVGTWEWNIQTGETIFNERWAEIIGYTLENLPLVNIDTWAQYAHPDDIKQSKKLLRVHFKGEAEYYDMECRLRHRHGHWIWVHVRGKVISFTPDGKPLWMFGTHFEITERKKMEADAIIAKQKAEEASKAKSGFLAEMSHEIRTPLNGIIGFSELMAKTPLNNIQKQYLQSTSHAAYSLLEIVNDILNLSKIEAGKLELDIVEVDLLELLEQTAEIVQYRASHKGLELLLAIEPEMPRFAHLDPLRLRQILINLLGNAVKFTKEGEVELSVSFESINQKEGVYHFAVRDTGIGISATQKQRIFEAFSQAETSTFHQFGGTGLGLSISAGLAEKMGSRITVNSSLGKGSTFEFSIKTTFKDRITPYQQSPKKVKRLLLVDDNPNSTKIFVRLFKYWQMQYTHVSNGLEALKELSKNRYDLALIDQNLPYLNGVEVLEKIRQHLSLDAEKLPVTLLHSLSNIDEIQQDAEKLDVKSILTKPVKIKAIYDLFNGETAISPKPTKTSSIALKGDVLVVEDSSTNRHLIKIQLEKLSKQLEVHLAENGLEALEYVKKQVPDLILMDLNMPLMGGLEASRAIRKYEQDNDISPIKILMFTASNDEDDRQACLAAGVDGFLVKPLKQIELLEVLRKYLTSKNSQEDVSKNPNYIFNSHFNRDKLAEKLDKDTKLLKQLISLASQELPKKIQELSENIENEDIQAIQSAAHSIKGSAHNICFMRLAALAKRIEESAKQGSGDFSSLLHELKTEFDYVMAMIEEENIAIKS